MSFPGLAADVRRQFSERIVGPVSRTRKLAHETAAAMMEDLVVSGWPEGHLIGSVSDLRERFGVGRKACQEAIAIMQTRRFINVRRGVGGGLYVARPGLSDAAEALILYLVLSRVSLRAIRDARIIVYQLAVRAFMGRSGTGVHISSIADKGSVADFRNQLSRACGNATIAFLTELLEEVHQRYVAANAQNQSVNGQWGTCAQPLEGDLSDAIRSGDVERACQLIQEHGQMLDGFAANTSVDAACLIQTTRFFDSKKSCGRLAGQIIEEILAQPAGVPYKLGSERDIGGRHGFTSDIVRPALRMLEDLGIIACWRGRGGGAVSTAPSIGTVVRLISAGVADCGISPIQNFELASQLVEEGGRLAAERNGGVASSSAPDISPERIAGLADLIDVENVILDLLGNPILAIFVRSLALQSLSSNGLVSIPSLPAKIASAVHACSMEISLAIRKGEVKIAVDAAERKREMMRREVVAVS